ncbi:MAG: hypothetical protein JNN11_01460 [Candidatus Doudnabacteria bacterium]|nr:hypothetical protein [Candidatus Doudnabacteria bacterium]
MANPVVRKIGFASLEAIVGLFLLAGVSASVFSLVFLNQSLALRSELHMQAVILAQAELEAAKAEIENEFNAVINKTIIKEVFRVNVSAQYINNWSRKVVSQVFWPQGVTEMFFVYIHKDAFREGDACGLSLKGNWTSPTVLPGQIFLGTGEKATGIDVKGKFAYITADSSTLQSADFFVVDISVPENPHMVASINTGPGLGGVKVVGDLAYVVNLSTVSQLQIINISNPSEPFLVYSYVTGSAASGRSLYYSNLRIYLGTEISQSREFYIIDVTDPSAPRAEGSFELGTTANSIKVSGNYAYVATPSVKQVWVLNVSDPANIVEVSNFSPNGSGILHGNALYLAGDKLYFGRTGLVAGAYEQLYFFNNLNFMPLLSDFSQDINTSVNGIFERSGWIFLATNEQDKEFQVWAKNGLVLNFKTALDLHSKAVDFDCEDEKFFVVLEGGNALTVIKPGS